MTTNVLKTALVAGAFAASMLAVSTPAQAGKYSTFTAAINHYIECANWLVSDPAKHAQFCDPGHDVFLSGTTGSAAAPTDDECSPCPYETDGFIHTNLICIPEK